MAVDSESGDLNTRIDIVVTKNMCTIQVRHKRADNITNPVDTEVFEKDETEKSEEASDNLCSTELTKIDFEDLKKRTKAIENQYGRPFVEILKEKCPGLIIEKLFDLLSKKWD